MNNKHVARLLQKQQERCDAQTRTITSLEERCISLKSTIEQMNHSLEKASTAESEMKAEINHMHRSLIEINAHSQSDADKIRQVVIAFPYTLRV
jgi:rootletin